ncbi:MAG TPA: YbjN domain-containing protein, partial [Mycobacteriales bacterium]|nr:YbjN domain-containing protein [Mycobacteriales bacterium]
MESAPDGTRDELDTTLRAALDAAGLEFSSPQPGQFLVKLVGQHKLATMCWLVAGEHALLVEAFVLRRPDENQERLYHLLLSRNSRMYAVSWALDKVGDVFLVGRVPLHAVNADEVDRLLGAVLSYADDTFDTML